NSMKACFKKSASHLLLIETFEPTRRFSLIFPITLSPSFKPSLTSTRFPIRSPETTGISVARSILDLKHDLPTIPARHRSDRNRQQRFRSRRAFIRTRSQKGYLGSHLRQNAVVVVFEFDLH